MRVRGVAVGVEEGGGQAEEAGEVDAKKKCIAAVRKVKVTARAFPRMPAVPKTTPLRGLAGGRAERRGGLVLLLLRGRLWGPRVLIGQLPCTVSVEIYILYLKVVTWQLAIGRFSLETSGLLEHPHRLENK